MYKVIHGLFAIRLRNGFQNTSQVHSHKLRSSNINLFMARPLSEAGKRSFQYGGCNAEQPSHCSKKSSYLHIHVSIAVFYFYIVYV